MRPGEDDVTSTVLVFAFGLAAKLERMATNERIAAACVREEAKGETGRPRKTLDGDAERTRQMKERGESVPEIAKTFRVSVPTMYRLLRSAIP